MPKAHIQSESRRMGAADRRARPTPAFSRFLFRGRRRKARRASEARAGYYVDRPGPKALAAAALLMVLTLLDGAFTLRLLAGGATEENPLMAYTLSLGVSTFLLAKYLLTVPSVGLLLVHKNFTLLHPRLRVKWILASLLGIYGTLCGYELALFGLMEASG
ncbi:MAG: hypothetical protein FJ189_05065 [Gammaproteobacteria bacterium]|nr:hypothetical protein [Gammaproteobacteria bacterium]